MFLAISCGKTCFPSRIPRDNSGKQFCSGLFTEQGELERGMLFPPVLILSIILAGVREAPLLSVLYTGLLNNISLYKKQENEWGCGQLCYLLTFWSVRLQGGLIIPSEACREPHSPSLEFQVPWVPMGRAKSCLKRKGRVPLHHRMDGQRRPIDAGSILKCILNTHVLNSNNKKYLSNALQNI